MNQGSLRQKKLYHRKIQVQRTPENTTDQNQETKPIDIQGNVTEKPENKKDNKSSEDAGKSFGFRQ